MQALTVAISVVLGLGLAALGIYGAARYISGPRRWRPHYLRLGRVAPNDDCPCKRPRKATPSYQGCCRPSDIAALERDIQDYLWRRWTHASYAGRRRSNSMEHRLRDYPIPQPKLPRWVTNPEEYTFPLDERTLRTWSPWPRRGLRGEAVKGLKK